jgi:flavin-binding protein dodecin
VAKDPDALAREIEATRAGLAETIDAIAEKVSPRRATERTVARVKEKVADLRGQVQSAGGATYQVRRQLRTDRVALAAGTLTATAVVVVVVRRRRRRATLTDRLLRR